MGKMDDAFRILGYAFHMISAMLFDLSLCPAQRLGNGSVLAQAPALTKSFVRGSAFHPRVSFACRGAKRRSIIHGNAAVAEVFRISHYV
jgi:hypothetical protein